MEKIKIFDTTLRDGEQSPGASLNGKEKLEIARQLVALGVDVIEAGFPAASPGDFLAVKEIASTVKGAIICGLARCKKEDIDIAYKAVKHSARPRIHVFLATSKIHMRYKLRKAEDEIIKLAVWGVKYAKGKVSDVEFSPEDASRTDRRFLYRVIEAVIDAGATTVNIPDTVGYAVPFEFGDLIGSIKANVPNIKKAVISVHCHNDLGLGVSNSLEAVKNGAGQVECTINGLGERAGNASLEEIVMALDTRRDLFGKTTSIDKKEIYKTSRLVSKLTGILVQPNKAIVGKNAFSHEAGIHQDGMLKMRTTYEIMKSEDVGFGKTRLVLGKHSGSHAFKERLKSLGFHLNEKELNRAFDIFKKLADKKKEIYDEDLETIVEDELRTIPELYKLESLSFTSGTNVTPRAEVVINVKKKRIRKTSTGDGPVDACYKAIDKVTSVKPKLIDYSIRAVTGGKDALGEVTVRLKVAAKEVSGRGSSTDIVEASAKAYIDAVNKAAYKNRK
ncbi:MAG: 2-isopropylmalate synthase [Candidatus Omnitrophica bacterium]|nr:2-isopropylmalate synthase [Candidatus Omnitrophota bacterium]